LTPGINQIAGFDPDLNYAGFDPDLLTADF